MQVRPTYAGRPGQSCRCTSLSERGGLEKEANRMAICRKKIKGDALDEVQDETLGLRKRIVGRFADRTQMTMEAAFHTRNVGQIQDGTCNFPAQQARLGSRPQESRRRPAALLACSAREAPHSGRFRLRANRPATLGRGGWAARRQSFCKHCFRIGPWQQRCVDVEVRVRCPSSSLRGVAPHG